MADDDQWYKRPTHLGGALFLTHGHVGLGSMRLRTIAFCVSAWRLAFWDCEPEMAPTACADYMPVARLAEMKRKKKMHFKGLSQKSELLKTMIFGAALKSLPFTGLLKTPISGQPTVKPRVRRPFCWRTAGWLTIGLPGSRCVASLQSAPSLVFSDDHSEPKWEVTMGCPPFWFTLCQSLCCWSKIWNPP